MLSTILFTGSYVITQTVSSTIKASIITIKWLQSMGETPFLYELEELDLIPLLTTIDEYLKTKDVRITILKFVQETTLKIHKSLEDIELELKEHKLRYFHSWRSPNTEEHMVKIRVYEKQLRKRWGLYLQIYK